MGSEQTCQLLGVTESNEWPIALFLHLVHPDDRGKVEEVIRKALVEDVDPQKEFRIHRLSDKQERWVSSYGKVIKMGNPSSRRIVGVLVDITERKKLEQQKEDFLGIASHELKTPLTTISAYGELLEEMLKNDNFENERAFATKLNTQVRRLKNLIDDLLDFTRINEGQIPLSYEHFPLSSTLVQIQEEFQGASGSHQIEFQCQENVVLYADKKRIEQVVTNLVSNAIKYSPKGGKVQVKCEASEDQVKISVSDEGIGIPEEARKNLFRRFYRVPQKEASELPGMGLGLYISAGFVYRHGGKIWVESEPGKGSTFYFTLPLHPPGAL